MRLRGLLLLASVVVAVLLVEAGLRIRAELRSAAFVGAAVPTDDTQPDPLLVAWFKPNYHAPGGYPNYDGLGFRLNGSPREGPGQHPIVLLGGSTAYGWGSPDDETIAALLERTLRERGGDPSQPVVINAGYPGLTSLDTLLIYHAKVASLRPARVILLAGLNDVYYAIDWNLGNRLHWANRTYELGLRARHEPTLRPLVDAIDRIALGNCFTCYALGTGLSHVYDRTRLLPALGLAEVLGQEPLGSDNPRAMQLTAWAIGELARWVQADGGCLVVAWQPIAGVPSGPHSANEQEAVERVSRNAPSWPTLAPRMFAELKAATQPLFTAGVAREVDLTDAFDEATETVFVDDGVHYTALGNRLIAEALAERQLADGTCSDAHSS